MTNETKTPSMKHEHSLEQDPMVGTGNTTDSFREAAATTERDLSLSEPPHGAAIRSRKFAGALGVLFGWLGLHRFYLGFKRIGATQLGLSIAIAVVVLVIQAVDAQPFTLSRYVGVTAGVLMLTVLWGVFEGIVILTGGLRADADDRPLAA